MTDHHGFTVTTRNKHGNCLVGDPFVNVTLPEPQAIAVMKMIDRAYRAGQDSVWRGLSKAAGVPLPWNGDVQAGMEDWP